MMIPKKSTANRGFNSSTPEIHSSKNWNTKFLAWRFAKIPLMPGTMAEKIPKHPEGQVCFVCQLGLSSHGYQKYGYQVNPS